MQPLNTQALLAEHNIHSARYRHALVCFNQGRGIQLASSLPPIVLPPRSTRSLETQKAEGALAHFRMAPLGHALHMRRAGVFVPSCGVPAVRRGVAVPALSRGVAVLGATRVHQQGPARVIGSSRRRAPLKVQAVFEKFSERSIKSVMIAQAEAKAFGTTEVGVAGVVFLLGLGGLGVLPPRTCLP